MMVGHDHVAFMVSIQVVTRTGFTVQCSIDAKLHAYHLRISLLES